MLLPILLIAFFFPLAGLGVLLIFGMIAASATFVVWLHSWTVTLPPIETLATATWWDWAHPWLVVKLGGYVLHPLLTSAMAQMDDPLWFVMGSMVICSASLVTMGAFCVMAFSLVLMPIKSMLIIIESILRGFSLEKLLQALAISLAYYFLVGLLPTFLSIPFSESILDVMMHVFAAMLLMGLSVYLPRIIEWKRADA